MSEEKLIAELKEIQSQADKLRSKTLRNFLEVYRVSQVRVLFNPASTRRGKMKAKALAEELGVSLRTAEDYLKAVRIFNRLYEWCRRFRITAIRTMMESSKTQK